MNRKIISASEIKKTIVTLIVCFISFINLFSQEPYNKYYHKDKVSFEEIRAGIKIHLTNDEQKWVKEWKQQLKDKADNFRERTGFIGGVSFHQDRASLKQMHGKFDCISVVDTATAIIAANQILDEITDLINVPQNQIQRTRVTYLEHTYKSEWHASYKQYINGIEIVASGSSISFKGDGSFYRCGFNFYPDLPTDIHPKFTEEQLQEKIRNEYNITEDNTFKYEKYYYRVGRFGDLSLIYKTVYSNFQKSGYSLPYEVHIDATTGDLLSNSFCGIPEGSE